MGIKKIISALCVFGVASTALYAQSSLKIGDKLPELTHRMDAVSGNTISLRQATASNGLLILFSCNTCPWVAKWENRYNQLYQLSRQNSIGMIALNPNENGRNRGESLDDMMKRADKKNYTFPYAIDLEHKIADALGATHTPQIFLFDKNLELVYRGAIDKSPDAQAGNGASYAERSIEQLAGGNKPNPATTKPSGCLINRNE